MRPSAPAPSPDMLDTAMLRQWIGRTEQATDLITTRLVREFRATLDQEAGDLAEGSPAPLAIHWCLAPPTVAMSGLGADGHPARGGFLPPVPLPRRMWAGGSIDFVDPLRIGDAVQRISRIADVTVKQGKSGTLCFVAVDHDFTTSRGVALRERHDIVYRDMGRTVENTHAQAEAPAPRAEWRKAVEATPVLLFRYSALTFNGHLIHYDRRYCREVESYPGLVVHGPLQATLLLDLAAKVPGFVFPRFSYRGVRPIFDGGEFYVNAVRTPEGMSLWTTDHRGRTGMTATATR
jgi:3-methylfumaryl-CoA hydratase